VHKTILIDAELAQLKGTHAKILIVLKGHANAARQCWPSTRTLADKAHLSTTTIRKALAEMQSLGYIDRQSRGRRRSAIYILAERFAPGDMKIAALKPRRKTRSNASPVPLLDLAIDGASESQIDSLSESDRTVSSESVGDSEVLHLKSTIPNGMAADAASPPIALPSIWPNAIAYLATAGIAERRARGLVASWRRDHGDGPALDALAAAEAASASDPVSFVQAHLGGNHGRSGHHRGPRKSFAARAFEVARAMAERDAVAGGGARPLDAALGAAGNSRGRAAG
jgi:DNA-binding MarR family transcriptional regulator